MADFVDMLATPLNFANPSQSSIDRATVFLDKMIADLTAIKDAADEATTAPVPPATTPVAITIGNIGDLNLDTHIATFTTSKTALDEYKEHTDALTNVNVGAYEPSYNHLLSASGTIQNAAELKRQIIEKGGAIDPNFQDVMDVADMNINSIMDSISPATISHINANISKAEAEIALMTEYDDLLTALQSRDQTASEAGIDSYAPKLVELVIITNDVTDDLAGKKTSDVTNYNTISAVAEKLSGVALLFAGLSDPLLAENMAQIASSQ